jgi:hypothetical protein
VILFFSFQSIHLGKGGVEATGSGILCVPDAKNGSGWKREKPEDMQQELGHFVAFHFAAPLPEMEETVEAVVVEPEAQDEANRKWDVIFGGMRQKAKEQQEEEKKKKTAVMVAERKAETKKQTCAGKAAVFSADGKKCLICCEAGETCPEWKTALRKCDRAFLDGVSSAKNYGKARNRHLESVMHTNAVAALAARPALAAQAEEPPPPAAPREVVSGSHNS